MTCDVCARGAPAWVYQVGGQDWAVCEECSAAIEERALLALVRRAMNGHGWTDQADVTRLLAPWLRAAAAGPRRRPYRTPAPPPQAGP